MFNEAENNVLSSPPAAAYCGVSGQKWSAAAIPCCVTMPSLCSSADRANITVLTMAGSSSAE